jgi:hypothetical protein
LIEQHGLAAVINLGDDVSGTDAVRMLRALQAQGYCMTLAVGVLHTNAPTQLIKSADVVVDGPACGKAFIEHNIEEWPGSVIARATWHCFMQIPGTFGKQVYYPFAWAGRSLSRIVTTFVVSQRVSPSPWLGRITCQTVYLTYVR